VYTGTYIFTMNCKVKMSNSWCYVRAQWAACRDNYGL